MDGHGQNQVRLHFVEVTIVLNGMMRSLLQRHEIVRSVSKVELCGITNIEKGL